MVVNKKLLGAQQVKQMLISTKDCLTMEEVFHGRPDENVTSY